MILIETREENLYVDLMEMFLPPVSIQCYFGGSELNFSHYESTIKKCGTLEVFGGLAGVQRRRDYPGIPSLLFIENFIPGAKKIDSIILPTPYGRIPSTK